MAYLIKASVNFIFCSLSSLPQALELIDVIFWTVNCIHCPYSGAIARILAKFKFFWTSQKISSSERKKARDSLFFGVPSLLGLNRCDLLARQLYEPSLF